MCSIITLTNCDAFKINRPPLVVHLEDVRMILQQAKRFCLLSIKDGILKLQQQFCY